MAQAQTSARSGFRLTPVWFTTVVFCGLATYVVVKKTNDVTEVNVPGGAGVKFRGTPLTDTNGSEEKLKELAEQIKEGAPAPAIAPSEAPSREQIELIEKISQPSSAPTAPPVDIAGVWRDAGGSTYQITPTAGGVYTFSETSNVYGIPMQTAVGQGNLNGNRFEFTFNSILGIPGIGMLRPTDARTLQGVASFPATGAQVPLHLTR